MLSRRHVLAAALAIGIATSAFPAAAQDKLTVVASFSILADFAREIAGERAAVTTLVGPDGDAHVYSPTPADAKAVAEAKVLIVNGLKFEGWMDRLVKSSATKATVVTATAGITPLALPGEKDHDHGKKAGHGHDHAGQSDPHAWQSVANAKVYVANIREALIKADPAGRSVYEANATAYLGKLDELERDIAAEIARIPADRRKIVTSHDAFGYFAKAYGISFVAPQGVSTEAEASAKDVARIIRQIKAQKIPAVFLENVTNPRLAEQITRESGAKMGGRLYSDALSVPTGPAATYISMMRYNIRELGKALGTGPS
jgi:zinc/manganese transport system substrate-binding protein